MKPGIAFLTVVALVSTIVVGCSGSSTSPSGSAARTASGVISNGEPSQVIVAQLALTAEAYDGQKVLVTGGFLYAANGQQLLCDTLLESYPPQPSGNQVGLVGQLPDLALSQLQSTANDPTLARVTWGQVSVIGTFHAASGATAAHLDMESIRIENGVRGLD
jgi:hypothetical protein